jgi:hypothetical protein
VEALQLRPLPALLWDSRERALYLKETRGTRLYSIDGDGGDIRWERPANPGAALAGWDAECFYLVANEMTAVDRRRRTLRWSTALPMHVVNPSAFLGSDGPHILTSRGIYGLNPGNGDPRRIFRGHDPFAKGGHIVVVGERYLCVSNQAITAYGGSRGTGPAPGEADGGREGAGFAP